MGTISANARGAADSAFRALVEESDKQVPGLASLLRKHGVFVTAVMASSIDFSYDGLEFEMARGNADE